MSYGAEMKRVHATAVLRGLVAMFSLCAGVVHLGVVRAHLREDVSFGVFFLAVGVAQLVSAALVLRRPRRRVVRAIAYANLGVVLVWAVSRTVGLPFGPEPGVPEAIGLADGVATLLELLTVTWSFALLSPAAEVRLVTRRFAARMTGGVAAASAVLTTLALVTYGGAAETGEAFVAGHSAGAHSLHVIFSGGAAVVFVLYLARYVWENGPPVFSWRLDPGAPARRPAESHRDRVLGLGEGDPTQVA